MVIQEHTIDLNSSDPVELGLERERKLSSEPTTHRALQSLNPDDFNARLVFRMYRRTGTIEERMVATVDGKTARGANTDRPTVLEHVTGAILVRRQVIDRSIEIPALPELLKLFAPDGVMITADVLCSQVDTDGGSVGRKLRKRPRNLQMRRAVVRQQLECTDEQLCREADTVLAYLDLLANPGRFYELASPVVKRKLLTTFHAQIWFDDGQRTLQPVAEPREIVARFHQAARRVEGGSLRSRNDVEIPRETETMTDEVAFVEVAVGSGSASLTPVTLTKTPLGRNSEGVCSDRMSAVGTTGLEPVISCS